VFKPIVLTFVTNLLNKHKRISTYKIQLDAKVFISSFLAMFSLLSCAQNNNKKDNKIMSEVKIPEGVKTEIADFGSGCFGVQKLFFNV
jgi:hypothetical protein